VVRISTRLRGDVFQAARSVDFGSNSGIALPAAEPMDWKLILDVVFFVLTSIIAIVAILDVRKRMRDLIELQREAAWVRTANEMVWEFVDPAVEVHGKELSKALAEYTVFTQALNPQRTANASKEAAQYESLALANRMVRDRKAVWKPGFDAAQIEKMLEEWEAKKDLVRPLLAKKRFFFW
jgi:hypothetical protein